MEIKTLADVVNQLEKDGIASGLPNEYIKKLTKIV